MALSLLRKFQRAAVRAVGDPSAAVLALAIVASAPAHAGEPEIRKALAERLADLGKVDEVTKSPIQGLYEVRVGTEIYYTDDNGNYLIQGQLLDTKTRTNLTEARVAKLTAIDFASLPLKDAMVWKRGNGQRKIAVFSDPNCGFCKRLERTLQELNHVTVYTFLIPILGPDSNEKSRNVWCAKDSVDVWLDWMLRAKQPEKVTGKCDESAIQRNRAFARQHRITGTPAILFEDGSRAPGALDLQALEERLKRAEGREGKGG